MSMTPQTITFIPLPNIKVGDRLRKIDSAHAEVIAESIRQCGQIMSPISVRKEKETGYYSLIAGAHRMEAARLAGLSEIPAIVTEEMDDLTARLLEIDENLCRHELNALDRAAFLAERKTIYEEMHPETKAGIAGAIGKHNSANAMFAFAENVAEITGLSRRTIETAVKIYRELVPEARKMLIGSPIARNQSELQALSRRPPEEQRQIADALTRSEAPCLSVKSALAEIQNETITPHDPEEKLLYRIKDLWERATPRTRRKFITHVNRNRPLIKTEA